MEDLDAKVSKMFFEIYYFVLLCFNKLCKNSKPVYMYTTNFRGKLLAFVFFWVATISLTAQNLPYETVVQNGQSYYKYTVKPGEGLYAISRTFSVSVADIIRHNPGSNNGLRNGQQLLIPINSGNVSEVNTQSGNAAVRQASTPSAQLPEDQNNTFVHTVVRGETVFGISQMYNTSIEEIYRYNPQSRNGIAEGQALIVPQRRVISNVKEENYRYHTILPKETLYSVSRTYLLRPEDVIAANPGLSPETFRIGKTIRVPFFESNETFTPYHNQITNVTHTVKRGETLYSIARAYNVSQEDIERANPMLSGGLRTKMELQIPVNRAAMEGDDARRAESEANRLLSSPNRQSQRVDVLKVGLLLPFLDETGRGHLRLQEFYEGFAMAVDKLKNEGVNIDLYVFEIGKGNDTKKLQSLLGTLEMQSLNLVVGGINDAQIKVISDFSKAYNIKYVVPFSQNNGEVLNNGNIFQVNAPQQATYTKASALFMETYRNSNVIFVSGGRNDKTDFTTVLQGDLRKNNIKYETISLSSTLGTAIVPQLSTSRQNVIVPTTGDADALRQIIDQLDKAKEANPAFTLRLFGYPEWKTYSSALVKDYHRFGTYIFTSFYEDENALEVKLFNENFKKWYDRKLMDLNPRYGMWGYDIGLYFMTALRQFGTQFDSNINQVRAATLQHAFYFDRANNWGGFINNGMYLIHYDTNGLVTKINKSR